MTELSLQPDLGIERVGDLQQALQTILEEFDVGTLWMLRPWIYAQELLPRFARYTSAENLAIRKPVPRSRALHAACRPS